MEEVYFYQLIMESTWTPVNNGLTNTDINALAINGSDIFAGTDIGVFLSTDTGATWTPVNYGLPDKSTVWSLAVYGEYIFAGINGGGVYLSTNNGGTWNKDTIGLPGNTTVNSFAINGSDIYAATAGGAVFIATANGGKWFPLDTGLINNVSSLVINSGGIVFAGTEGGGVFLSFYNGGSWYAENTGLSNISVSSLAINGSNVFAGTNGGGMFLSSDTLLSWSAANTGLPNSATIYCLSVSGGNIFAGINGEGVWKRSLSDILGINQLQGNKSDVSINVSPNPVSQSSVISYQLSAKSYATLSIYDLTGRKVTTLVYEVKEKGQYSLKYNADELKNGLYFVKLSTDIGTKVAKFVKN